jgi:radical SAM superfamily enzyme YgiQ (UPF0313 family)
MTTSTPATPDFEIGIYRPPSEGGSNSLLLRVTRNCPWNRCEFCVMYKTEKFEVRSVEDIKKDINTVAAISRDLETVSGELGFGGAMNREVAFRFLEKRPEFGDHHGFFMVLNWLASGGQTAFIQDANSLIMKTDRLVDILKYLRRTFPSLKRVTSYARSKTLAQKTPEELKNIHEAGLDRVHVGLETGDDELLNLVRKGCTAEDHIHGGKKAVDAGFQLSEYWMPGLGGKEMWENHARNTARVLNEINPHYIRSRPFNLPPGTPMAERHQRRELTLLSPREQLLELKLMMETLNFTSRVCFDHAGNYWRNNRGGQLFSQSYEGYKFPEQKSEVLGLIEDGLSTQQDPPFGFVMR